MSSRARPGDLFSNPLLMGSIIIVIGLVGLVLSYNAHRGLPFVPTYDVSVDVPDAAELVAGSSEVRIGGARVGLVQSVRAMPGHDGRPAFSRLGLSLNRDEQRLPVDSVVQVRPRSILGAKYLDLRPGHSPRALPPGGVLSLRQARPAVEFDEAFGTFDAPTRARLRAVISSLGDGLAGRGGDLNRAIAGTARLMAPLQRVSDVLLARRTDLRGFIRGAAAAARALAPVAPSLGALLDHGATTLAALDAGRPQLAQAIDELTPTERTGTRVLTEAAPVLADAARLARALRPATRLLPHGTVQLAGAVRAATPVLRRGGALAGRTDALLAALDRLARDPSAARSVHSLTQAVTAVGRTLRLATPAQTACNIGGEWARNVSGIVDRGDADGAWITLIAILDPSQNFQSGSRAHDLHANPYPIENASECEAGNEPYHQGRAIGNAPGRQSGADPTAPPGRRASR